MRFNGSFDFSLHFHLFYKLLLKTLWVTFRAETSKDLEIILITIVLSFTNSVSRTSLSFSVKTTFVYSNLFRLAKTQTLQTHNSIYILSSKRV